MRPLIQRVVPISSVSKERYAKYSNSKRARKNKPKTNILTTWCLPLKKFDRKTLNIR